MIRIEDILNQIKTYYPDADLSTIQKAFVFAAKVHSDQLRRSGEPYLSHPLEVAFILAQLKMDIPTIVTGLLHDTVEDTAAGLDDIQEQFGEEIAKLVDGVTKLSQISFKSTVEEQAENFRKMIMAMAKDIRVILVKIADRTHNMRTLEYMSAEKQTRIAQETIDIYAPIANRLGISSIKIELEDLSLRYLKPDMYYKLVQKIAKKKNERETYIDEVKSVILGQLSSYGLTNVSVSGRPKHFYSIYKKMESRNLDFDQIYDIIAFRILTNTITQCYEALGIIHATWTPVPGRFKDYIAMPKANNYQSLHTTVIGPHGERLEVQIRTHEMHSIAEQGIAAHWKYKEGHVDKSIEEKYAFVRNLLAYHEDLSDPTEFIETVKLDLFAGDVYVFTPKGEVREFPHGSTPIDFAYSIHTDIGHHCIGAKVNGRVVPLRYRLKSGDTLEILTSPTQVPNKDWMKIVKTSKAKSKIRNFVKNEENVKSTNYGKELLEKELKKFSLVLSKIVKSKKFDEVCQSFGYKNNDSILSAIGYGKIRPMQIVSKFVPEDQLKKHTQEQKPSILQKIFQHAGKISSGKNAIKIKGVEDILVRFAKCCNPLPGDPIIGFISRGRGVSIHTVTCSKVLESDPERQIDVDWDMSVISERNAKIKVICIDKPGLLAEMSRVFTENNVNITQAQIRTTKDRKGINYFDVSVKNLGSLQKVIKELEKISGVISVTRVMSTG